MDWGDIGSVYWKEVRSLVRDRRTVAYSVLLPLFLYPAILWGTIQSLSYVKALEERRVSEVIVLDRTEDQRLSRYLENQGRLKISRLEEDGAEFPEAALRSTGAHVALVYRLDGLAAPERAAHATVLYDASRDASTRAKDRVLDALKGWRKRELQDVAEAVGEEEDLHGLLDVVEENLATRQEASGFTASMILPFISMVMMVLGALYPALEVTVAERERGTLETTLVTPTSREAIVMGKFLSVVTFTAFAFLMNAASLGFTLYHLSTQLKGEALGWEVSPSTAIVALAVALLLSAILGALIMLLAFFARTFKEGQTYLTPVYLLAMAPGILLTSPDISLGLGLAFVPLVNLLLVFREALRGQPLGLPSLISFAVSLVYAGLALRGASYLLRRESYVTGEGTTSGLASLFGFRRARSADCSPAEMDGE